MTFLTSIKRYIPNTVIKRRLDDDAGNCVLLTFDDGPHCRITPVVLELLAKYNAKAIFFLVGNRVEKYPNLLLQILTQGHLIGNHTYQHPNKTVFTFNEYRKDIAHCQKVIKKISGISPQLFRPPRGKITLAGLTAARMSGLSSVFWSNEGGENGSNKGLNAGTIAAKIISTVKPRDIILLHDDHSAMPEVLEKILPFLKQENFNLTDGINYLGGHAAPQVGTLGARDI